MSFCCLAWGSTFHEDAKSLKSWPAISISLYFPETRTENIHTTVYKNEVLRIPIVQQYSYLRGLKIWSITGHTTDIGLENLGPQCPGLYNDNDFEPYENAICNMNIVMGSASLPIGSTVSGTVTYRLRVQEIPKDIRLPLYFTVTVIPHRLSMTGIQKQSATIGQFFIYPLRNAVQYYDESISANLPVYLNMPQEEQKQLNTLGLYFEPSDFSIRGIPNKTGTFQFHVGASNVYGGTELTALDINIGINPQHKPRFKQHNDIASAMPDKRYSLDLVNLLENKVIFNETNQVTFKLDPNSAKPEGLNINAGNLTILEGSIPKNLAGQVVNATIIATSNTGGDSEESLTIHIPVAADPEQKSTINYFEMKQLAGNQFFTDMSSHIKDPANDSELKVIIDKIEPHASWLNISLLNPKALEGVVPNQATGQKYEITLHANTRVGGNSDSITVPLQINFDPRLTPQFKEDNPNLPMLFPGQPYSYNFVENRDIYPEYEDAAYEIKFSEEHEHPTWLKLENNRLFADPLVPSDLDELSIDIQLVITNKPGGSSKVLPLFLVVAN